MFQSRMLEAVKQSRYIPPVLLAVLIALLLVYGGEFIGAIVMFILAFSMGFALKMANPDINGAALQSMVQPFQIYFQLLLFAFIVLAVFFWVRFVEKRPFASLGFYKAGWLRELGKGFLIGAGQFSIVVALFVITGTGRLSLGQIGLQTLLFILTIIPFWILQGGAEELVTRGWLFPTVSEKSNILVGILISSLFFGALHIFNPGVTVLSIVNIVLDGIFACFLMLRYDNMWVLAGMHGAWNFVQGNIYGIEVSGQGANGSLLAYSNQSNMDWLSGGAFGAEGSILTSIVLIGCIAYLYWSLKKDGKLPQSLSIKK